MPSHEEPSGMGQPLRKRLILFMRYPVVGKVKTRLIPSLGAEGATRLHRRLVMRTLRAAVKAAELVGADVEIRFSGGSAQEVRHWLGDSFKVSEQSSGDLGDRMAHAFASSFAEGSESTIVIGSDCPMLSAELLASAFATLTQNDVVLGPATDGGYYLIGLKQPVPELFKGIHWGSSTVLSETQAILRNKGIRPALLEPLSDVDRPEDLEVWQKAVAHESNAPRSVSVIIPALNEESGLLATLKSVQQCASQETIVVDGGSTDGTLDVAKSAGAKVLKSSPSRARQMNAGAALAEGEALLFLHADTLLPANWLELVQHTLSQPGVAVGAFKFRIRESLRSKRLIEWGTNMRSELLALPYGDQGFFLKRALFEECGGFADQPIMEDVEFISRMRREGQVVIARGSVQTSGRRWKAGGFFRTVAANQLMLLGYWLGVDKRRLAGFYRQTGKK